MKKSMIRISKALIVGTLLLFTTWNLNGQSIPVISGRVVDRQGNPISKAEVFLWYPPCVTCSDHVIPSMETADEGLFYQSTSHIKDAGIVWLVVETGKLPGYFRLVQTPTKHLVTFARKIDTKKRKLIDLGDIRPTIGHVPFRFGITNWINDATDLRFSLKNRRGAIVTKEISVPASYWEDASTVKLMLPEGKWILDVSYQDKKSGHRRVRRYAAASIENEIRLSTIRLR